MRGTVRLLMLGLFLTSCGAPYRELPVDEPYLNIDGTYISNISVETRYDNGEVVKSEWGNQEIVINQFRRSVSLWEAVGEAGPEEVIFESSYTTRRSGPGENTNYQTVQVTGSGQAKAVTLRVQVDVYADGERIDGWVSDWVFDNYFRSF